MSLLPSPAPLGPLAALSLSLGLPSTPRCGVAGGGGGRGATLCVQKTFHIPQHLESETPASDSGVRGT